ncbi:MAG: patatin-like phospholipase family protein [Sphaerochaetaceae bacterium]
MALQNFRDHKEALYPQEERYILAIDGGGMRGLIPAVMLAKLSGLLESLGDNRPLYSHFDLLCGTSTGGLLALALGAPVQKTNLQPDSRYISYIYEVQEKTFMQKLFRKAGNQLLKGTLPFGVDTSTLESLYLQNGKQFFPKSQGRFFSQIFTDKYDVQPLQRFLQHIFSDIPLSEAVVPTMVMTYDAAQGKPFVMSSHDSHGFLFWEAARATSAAPTYFKPAYLYDRQEERMQTLIDGGVVANNPSLYAYRLAKELYPEAKRFHILSLSTASSDFTFTVSGAGTGVIGWIDPAKGAPIQKIYASSQMNVVDQIAPSIPNLAYYRIHGALGETYKLDETTAGALSSMHGGAQKIYQENEDQLKAVAQLLSQRSCFDQLELGPKEVSLPNQTPVQLEPPVQEIPVLDSYQKFLKRYQIEESPTPEKTE